MSKKRVLWLGFGDLGQRAAGSLINAGYALRVVSRSEKPMPLGCEQSLCDVSKPDSLAPLFEEYWDVIVITMSPSDRSRDGYRSTYFNVVQSCLSCLQAQPVLPKALIYISSTSVYGEGHGEIVNESTEAKPVSETAQVLLETENLLRGSPLRHCILRLSGIYGPDRFRLLQQVYDGNPGDNGYTNRIHAEDAASVIVFLIARALEDRPLPELLLGSDNQPVRSDELRYWLAAEMGLAEGHLNKDIARLRASTNRIIDNRKLRELGYEFQYPTYKQGFEDIVRAFLANKNQAT